MKALFKARGGKLIYCAALSLMMALPSFHLAVADAPRADGTLTILLDQARLVRIPDRATTVVVGNPLIADVSVQSGGLMVLTGKGYGRTNLIALDRSGNQLLEKSLLVTGPGENVVVYRGILRETYSCAPTCEPRITLGDGQTFFNSTLTQAVTRSNQASAIK
jgi:hypothetical protein